MGAHNFIQTAHGSTPEEAYRNAVDDALHEEGHNPYNGTISTTSGFVMLPLVDDEDLSEWEERILDDPRVQKWERCACTPHPKGRNSWVFAGWAAC